MSLVAAFYCNTVHNMQKMQQIQTFKFLKVVRQHVLGVVGNVITLFCWKFNKLSSGETIVKIGK